jgi:hypothetical protein
MIFLHQIPTHLFHDAPPLLKIVDFSQWPYGPKFEKKFAAVEWQPGQGIGYRGHIGTVERVLLPHLLIVAFDAPMLPTEQEQLKEDLWVFPDW